MSKSLFIVMSYYCCGSLMVYFHASDVRPFIKSFVILLSSKTQYSAILETPSILMFLIEPYLMGAMNLLIVDS